MHSALLYRIKPPALRYLHVVAVPLFLTLFLMIEQEMFARWIGLTGHPYLISLIGSTVGLGVVLFSPAAFLGRRTRYWYLFAVSIPVALILVSQYIYYSYANGFLQASAFSYARQAIDEKATIMTLLSFRLVLFLVPFLLIPLFAHSARRGVLKEILLTRKEKIVGLCVVCICVVSSYGLFSKDGVFTLHTVAHPYVALRDMNNFVFAPNDLVKKVGIVNYYLRDAVGFAFRHEALSALDIQFTKAWVAEQTPKETANLFGVARGRNLILLQVESLEHAVIGQSIGGVEITPNLNLLAKNGYYFQNYYTQVGPGNTADAEFVTLNSLYPLSNTVAFIDYAHNTFSALPQLLLQNNYYTAVLHDDVPTFWNRSNIYPALGYQEIVSKDQFIEQGEPVFSHLGDIEFLSQTLTKIQSFPSPFMATIITLSSHTPFIIPTSLQTLPIPDDADLNETQRNYLQSVHYTDAAIGQFMSDLVLSGLAQHSLVAIYGDHGSFTGISEKIGTSTNSDIDDLRTNQVPLILFAPGILKGKSLATPGSHLDLYPTVANLLGIETPNTLIGQDLLNTKSPIVTHRDPDSRIINAILSQDLAYTVSSDGVFAHGTCFLLPEKKVLPITICEKLYDSQLAATNASDYIVKGDLLPSLISGD